MAQALQNGLNNANRSQFNLLKVLGQGAFGKVFLVRKVMGANIGKLYAMKVVKKVILKRRDCKRIELERNILADVRHPFIVRLHYAFQTEGRLYLILDFLKAGDLFGKLEEVDVFTEPQAKFYLAEIASAVGHLHSLGIFYRDLKPENVLLDAEGHIALTDFGLSKILLPEEETYSFCGTVGYMAPEVASRRGHSFAADWWSFGVVMFEMLMGDLPFHENDENDISTQISTLISENLTDLTPQAQSLLEGLLKQIPLRRLGAGPGGVEDVKRHEFFSDIDFDALLAKKIRPPFQPTVCEPDDEYFDSEFTSQRPRESTEIPLSDDRNEIFKGFSFAAPCLDEAIPKITETAL